MSGGLGNLEVHQEVAFSALPLLACRKQALEVVDVPGSGSSIVATGVDNLNRWSMNAARSWSSLLSATPATSVTRLARSVAHNRRLVERGLKMQSVFDFGDSDSDAWPFLAAAQPDAAEVYFASFAPVTMRIVDYRFVLMQGPIETPSILRMSTPAALEAALLHWNTLFAHAVPCTEVSDPQHASPLTARQTLIIEQLRRGSTDAQIAASMSVSTRTVQSEVASVMARYGVTSRFALGYAYASGPPPDLEPPATTP